MKVASETVLRRRRNDLLAAGGEFSPFEFMDFPRVLPGPVNDGLRGGANNLGLPQVFQRSPAGMRVINPWQVYLAEPSV